MPREMPKFTKTPPEVVAAFDGASPARSDIARKTMFSYPALFVNGNMFAFTFGPKIAVRLEVPAKDMKGASLKRWIADGLAYAETLPAKTAKTKKTASKNTSKKAKK
ncbi:MAG: hypothetical protein E6I57_12045 [Chloroflexi bacterium]|nr:MAG: hypothetical protein E6I57_12045 [Chloroflexota bacterium]